MLFHSVCHSSSEKISSAYNTTERLLHYTEYQFRLHHNRTVATLYRKSVLRTTQQKGCYIVQKISSAYNTTEQLLHCTENQFRVQHNKTVVTLYRKSVPRTTQQNGCYIVQKISSPYNTTNCHCQVQKKSSSRHGVSDSERFGNVYEIFFIKNYYGKWGEIKYTPIPLVIN